MVYLLDPDGASRRSGTLRFGDGLIRALGMARDHAVELPYIPPFLHKEGGLVMSLGQFLQYVGTELMSTGTVQIWPGMPVEEALIEDGRVAGIRLADQGVDKRQSRGRLPARHGHPRRADRGGRWAGGSGRAATRRGVRPARRPSPARMGGGHEDGGRPARGHALEAGTVFHTFGYPEPEIFGFLYVHPDHVATVGIFVPSWFRSPVRTSYRYLQHYMLHPYLWRYLEGAKLRSWGAKSLQESGQRGEPFLAGDGYARIGEGSGSTNVLTGSGVDEAWTTGVQLAEAVVELLRRASRSPRRIWKPRTWRGGAPVGWRKKADRREGARRFPPRHGSRTAGHGARRLHRRQALGQRRAQPMPSPEEYYREKIPAAELEQILEDCRARGVTCHDALMDRVGWPAIPYDGQLLVSHQDALLIGGKVQAPAGFADHVRFLYPDFCERCVTKTVHRDVLGAGDHPGPGGVPVFDREKCVHCGACLWNCGAPLDDDPALSNIAFRAGAGGLHSTEN